MNHLIDLMNKSFLELKEQTESNAAPTFNTTYWATQAVNAAIMVGV